MDLFDLHWDASLIGPNGSLSRLHKGKPYTPKPPPPPAIPKEQDAMVGAIQMQKDQRQRRRSREDSYLGGSSDSSAKTFLG